MKIGPIEIQFGITTWDIYPRGGTKCLGIIARLPVSGDKPYRYECLLCHSGWRGYSDTRNEAAESFAKHLVEAHGYGELVAAGELEEKGVRDDKNRVG